MRIRRPRRTPSTRGGRVIGTPRARRRRKGPLDLKTRADQLIKAYQTKARSDKASKARSTPTPKAPIKKTKPTLQTTMPPVKRRRRPDVRPTKLGGTTGGTSASKAASANSAAGQVQKLKEAMKKKYASDRASKARSTGTPKAPTRRTRTAISPTRSTPTSVRKSRRPTVRTRTPMRRR